MLRRRGDVPRIPRAAAVAAVAAVAAERRWPLAVAVAFAAAAYPPEEVAEVVVAGDEVAKSWCDDDGDDSREGVLCSLAQRKVLGASRTVWTRPP